MLFSAYEMKPFRRLALVYGRPLEEVVMDFLYGANYKSLLTAELRNMKMSATEIATLVLGT